MVEFGGDGWVPSGSETWGNGADGSLVCWSVSLWLERMVDVMNLLVVSVKWNFAVGFICWTKCVCHSVDVQHLWKNAADSCLISVIMFECWLWFLKTSRFMFWTRSACGSEQNSRLTFHVNSTKAVTWSSQNLLKLCRNDLWPLKLTSANFIAEIPTFS